MGDPSPISWPTGHIACRPAYPLTCPASSSTQRIMDSINRGIPVLAFGVVGPSDCCIITGYDQGGDVLLGWSTYQDIPEDHNIPHDVTGPSASQAGTRISPDTS